MKYYRERKKTDKEEKLEKLTNYSFKFLEPSWWRMFVFNPLKEANILDHNTLMKSSYKKIFDEWFDWKESKELENAIYWYDSEIDKIKQDAGASKTQKIGDKTYTFEARNTDFHEDILIKEKFGET